MPPSLTFQGQKCLCMWNFTIFFNNECFISKCTSVRTEKCSIKLHLRNLKTSNIQKFSKGGGRYCTSPLPGWYSESSASHYLQFWKMLLLKVALWIVSSFPDWKLCCYTVNPYVYYSTYFVMFGHSNFWGWRFIRIFFRKSQWCKYGEEPRMCVWKLLTLEWFSMHFYRYCLFFYLSLFLNEFSRFGKHIDICPIFEVLFLT